MLVAPFKNIKKKIARLANPGRILLNNHKFKQLFTRSAFLHNRIYYCVNKIVNPPLAIFDILLSMCQKASVIAIKVHEHLTITKELFKELSKYLFRCLLVWFLWLSWLLRPFELLILLKNVSLISFLYNWYNDSTFSRPMYV